MPRHKKKHGFKFRSFHVWHRTLGLCAAIFVVTLAVTGVLLNHTEEIGLDSRHVRADWLLDWYGIVPPATPISYPVNNHWISQLGARVYYDGREISNDAGHLVGAVRLPEMLVVAVEGHLILLTPGGEHIETMGGSEGVPAGMRAVGVNNGNLAVRAAHGDYLADADLLKWKELPHVDATWAAPVPLPQALHQRLLSDYRGKGLPVERVILDLHSGRIVGAWGPWIMDAAAGVLIFLAATGCWMWLRQRRRRHEIQIKGK